MSDVATRAQEFLDKQLTDLITANKELETRLSGRTYYHDNVRVEEDLAAMTAERDELIINQAIDHEAIDQLQAQLRIAETSAIDWAQRCGTLQGQLERNCLS